MIFKIIFLKLKAVSRAKDSMFFTEAIGLPVTIMQPIAPVKALLFKDWLGAAITLWWGPGFVTVVAVGLEYIVKKFEESGLALHMQEFKVDKETYRNVVVRFGPFLSMRRL